MADPRWNVAWKGRGSSCAEGLAEPSNDGSLQQRALSDLEHRIGVPRKRVGTGDQQRFEALAS